MVLCLSLSELEARNQSQQQAQLQETRHAAELLSQRAEKGTVCLSISLTLPLSLSPLSFSCLSVCQLNCRVPGMLLNCCLREQGKVNTQLQVNTCCQLYVNWGSYVRLAVVLLEKMLLSLSKASNHI